MTQESKSLAFVAPPTTDAKGNALPGIGAIKAMAKGTARPDQQKTALDYIINRLCCTYDLSFRLDNQGGERGTAFAEGRRLVGLQLAAIITQPLEVLTGE